MSDQGYEYECMRAELLGQEKPDRATYEASKAAEQESPSLPSLPSHQDLACETEQLNRTAGGLEELNSLLALTKRKLDKCKNACGRISSIIKGKVLNDQSVSTVDKPKNESCDTDGHEKVENIASSQFSKLPEEENSKRMEVGKQIDKLDMLLEKAEHAELSLQSQNKQIRKVLK